MVCNGSSGLMQLASELGSRPDEASFLEPRSADILLRTSDSGMVRNDGKRRSPDGSGIAGRCCQRANCEV